MKESSFAPYIFIATIYTGIEPHEICDFNGMLKFPIKRSYYYNYLTVKYFLSDHDLCLLSASGIQENLWFFQFGKEGQWIEPFSIPKAIMKIQLQWFWSTFTVP